MTPNRRFIHRLVTPPLRLVAAILWLLEEWLWEHLKRAMARLAAWPPVARAEARIAGLGPAAAAVVFLLPTSLLIPVKLVAVWSITRGHVMTGLAVILLAKLLGMALFSRIFVLCRPALLRVSWFRRLHDRVLWISLRVHAWLESSRAWNALRETMLRWRRWARARIGPPSLLVRRWKALRRRLARRGERLTG
jgi:hypothetical protein